MPGLVVNVDIVVGSLWKFLVGCVRFGSALEAAEGGIFCSADVSVAFHFFYPKTEEGSGAWL